MLYYVDGKMSGLMTQAKPTCEYQQSHLDHIYLVIIYQNTLLPSKSWILNFST